MLARQEADPQSTKLKHLCFLGRDKAQILGFAFLVLWVNVRVVCRPILGVRGGGGGASWGKIFCR